MKILEKFEGFKKLYEGGGAGINFKMDSMLIQISFSINENLKIKTNKFEIELDESFNAHGYQDGMSNIDTDGMFNIEKEFDLNSDVELNIEENIVGKQKSYNNLKELVQKEGPMSFDVEVSLTDIENMLFGGYVRGDISEGSVIFEIPTKGSDGYYNINYETNAYSENENYEITNDEAIIDALNIELKATKKFVQFYNDVFENYYENAMAFTGKEDLDTEDYQDYNDHLTFVYGV